MTEDNVCYAQSSRGAALFWTTLAFFGGFAGVSAFGPIVSKLKHVLALSPILMGLIVASPALTGSLLRIPFGAMVDRMGGKKPIIILLGMAALGIAGITMMFWMYPIPRPSQYPLFFLFGMLCGCGIAVFSVGIPTVSYWHSQKTQGSALAIYAGLGNLAPGMFALLLPYLVVSMGFTFSYVLWLGMLVILILLVFVYMKDAPYFQYREMGIEIDPDALLLACGEELIPSGTAMGSIRKAGSDWRTWILTYFYFVTFGGFIALTVWLPIYWTELHRFSLVKAGGLTALYSLSASLMRVLGIQATRSVGLGCAGEMILALGMGFANAAVFKLVPKYSPKAVGGAAGIIGGLGAFGGFAIPPIMGLFVKINGAAGYSQGFSVFLGLTILALILFRLLKRYARPKIEK